MLSTPISQEPTSPATEIITPTGTSSAIPATTQPETKLPTSSATVILAVTNTLPSPTGTSTIPLEPSPTPDSTKAGTPQGAPTVWQILPAGIMLMIAFTLLYHWLRPRRSLR